MSDGFFWGMIGAGASLAAAGIAFTTFWMKISRDIATADGNATAAEAAADNAQHDASQARAVADAATAAAGLAKAEAESSGLRAVQANLKIDGLQTSLSEFRVYVEREFINHADMAQLSKRNEAQFGDLRDALKGITERLDRLLDGPRKPHSRG